MNERESQSIPTKEQINKAAQIFRAIPRKEFEVTCEICNDPFPATRVDARYCSPRCRQRASRQQRKSNS